MCNAERAWRPLAAGALLLCAAACGSATRPAALQPDTAMVPLTELGTRTYLGFTGGLYPNGQNGPPAAHEAAGIAAAARVVPLGPDGKASASGRIVLLSVGMSNTTMEFCSGSFPACASWSFAASARSDPSINPAVVVVDGARGGQAAPSWQSPGLPQFDSARARLAAAGVTEAQVQVVWIKQADMQPRTALPAADADATVLESELGDIVRALKVRYPNLRQAFLSSRIYGGYATTTLNPEPYAYEGGFSVKWLIEAQIRQMGGGAADARAGNLSYNGPAPWLAWGPYLWAAGTKPGAGWLVWEPADFGADGTHPSDSGRRKVSAMLTAFFKTSPFTRCWFLAAQRCPPAP